MARHIVSGRHGAKHSRRKAYKPGARAKQWRELGGLADRERAPRPARTMSENTQRGLGKPIDAPGNSGTKIVPLHAAMAASHSLLAPRKRARLYGDRALAAQGDMRAGQWRGHHRFALRRDRQRIEPCCRRTRRLFGSGRRARLLAASAISGGTLRGWAVAAGVAATLGAAPAFAGCNSGSVPDTNLLSSPACQASATGVAATAVGHNANANGPPATATGDDSFANGTNATATGRAQHRERRLERPRPAQPALRTAPTRPRPARPASRTARRRPPPARPASRTAARRPRPARTASRTATSATATGVASVASGISATATGPSSFANGGQATATGVASVANGSNATATGESSFGTG